MSDENESCSDTMSRQFRPLILSTAMPSLLEIVSGNVTSKLCNDTLHCPPIRKLTVLWYSVAVFSRDCELHLFSVNYRKNCWLGEWLVMQRYTWIETNANTDTLTWPILEFFHLGTYTTTFVILNRFFGKCDPLKMEDTQGKYVKDLCASLIFIHACPVTHISYSLPFPSLHLHSSLCVVQMQMHAIK